MSKQLDQYEAENYRLAFQWNNGVVEIIKAWKISGEISVTKLTKSETLALVSFIEGNLEEGGGVTGIDDWVDLV